MQKRSQPYRILAIESSCDDSAVAVVEDGQRVLASLVSSQEALHAAYGGVVPEVASREHLPVIYRLIGAALRKAKLTESDIDAIAVTDGPGLMGSLMVGVDAARTLGWLWKKPVVGVNHLQGHVYSGWLAGVPIEFPVVALVASGGHTEIVLMQKHGDYEYLGGTVDDAVGESFDKIARWLGLGYPGGPVISKLAAGVARSTIQLPRPMLRSDDYNFSFSGLKTATMKLRGNKAKIARAFEDAAVDVLVAKVLSAAKEYGAATVIVGGGVAANQRLRERLSGDVLGEAKVIFPAMEYCRDNAAMIGVAAFFVNRGRLRGEWYNTKVTI